MFHSIARNFFESSYFWVSRKIWVVTQMYPLSYLMMQVKKGQRWQSRWRQRWHTWSRGKPLKLDSFHSVSPSDCKNGGRRQEWGKGLAWMEGTIYMAVIREAYPTHVDSAWVHPINLESRNCEHLKISLFSYHLLLVLAPCLYTS